MPPNVSLTNCSAFIVPIPPTRPSWSEVADVAQPPAQAMTAPYCSALKPKLVIAVAASRVKKSASPKAVPSAFCARRPVGVSEVCPASRRLIAFTSLKSTPRRFSSLSAVPFASDALKSELPPTSRKIAPTPAYIVQSRTKV